MAKKYLPIRLSEELIKKVTEKAKKAKEVEISTLKY